MLLYRKNFIKRSFIDLQKYKIIQTDQPLIAIFHISPRKHSLLSNLCLFISQNFILRFPLIRLLVSRLGRKETVPPVPLSNTATAVGTLTLHTGVRNRHMEIASIKNACYIVAGFPTVALC